MKNKNLPCTLKTKFSARFSVDKTSEFFDKNEYEEKIKDIKNRLTEIEIRIFHPDTVTGFHIKPGDVTDGHLNARIIGEEIFVDADFSCNQEIGAKNLKALQEKGGFCVDLLSLPDFYLFSIDGKEKSRQPIEVDIISRG